MNIESENYLNQCYSQDYLRLMYRDKDCLYCYWEVTEDLLAMACRHYGGKPYDYPITLRILSSKNYQVVKEQQVDPIVNNWFFIIGCTAGSTYHAELGVLIGGIFIPLIKSNSIVIEETLPIHVPSNLPTSDQRHDQQPTQTSQTYLMPISSSEFIQSKDRKGDN